MKIKFIEDIDFDLSNSDDLLGTKPYAETLFEVVKESKGKQNIGLFGGWGSGKSTIIKTLEKFIYENNKISKNNKIAFFKFDAWKYSNDEFRRSFIKSLNSKFEVVSDKDLEQILYQEITTEDVEKTSVKPNYPTIIALLVAAIILILVVSEYVLPNIPDDKDKSLLVITSIIASFLFYFARDFFRIIPFTYKESKIIEAERFEDTFTKITNSIFGKTDTLLKKFSKIIFQKSNYKKIVVVIDNLDRCDNKNLLETLSTIKNFLENDNIIFILPVDENGVTSFLDKNTEDADEYLRKIFHLIIRLKKFTSTELIEFTKAININYKLYLSHKGIRLICQEFTTNPRKIIQFLNNLQTERNLLKRQIKEGYINIEYNEQVDNFLIKILIIKQEWNDLYNRILDDVNYLNKINDLLRNKIIKKDNFYYLGSDDNIIKLTENQKRFFKRNIDIHFSNIESFILNIDIDKDVPDGLRKFIENGELDEALSLLSINDKSELNDINVKLFLNQVEKVYDDNSNKFEDYTFIALPVSELIFDALKYKQFQKEIKSNFKEYTFIKKIFINSNFSNLIDNLGNYENFCKASKWFVDEVNYNLPFDNLLNNLNRSIEPSVTIVGANNKVNNYLNTFKDDNDKIKSIKNNFSNRILKNPEELNEFDILKNNLNVAVILLNDEFFSKSLDRLLIDKDFLESDETLFNILNQFIENEYLTNNEVVTKYVNKLFDKLESNFEIISNNSKAVFNIKEVIKKLNYLIPKSIKELLILDEDLLSDINQSFLEEADESLSIDEINIYISFLNMILSYMHINPDYSTDENFEMYFNHIFIKTDVKELSLGINDIYRKEINKYNAYEWDFFDTIIDKLDKKINLKYIETLMLMFNKSTKDKGLNSEQKYTLVSKLVSVFFYYKEHQILYKDISKWLSIIVNKDKTILPNVIDELDNEDFEKYIYNIYKFNNDTFIGDSFNKYLDIINNFNSFQKFIKFIYDNHTINIQKELLNYYILNYSFQSFNWVFSSQKYIHKSIFYNIILDYFDRYSGKKDNVAYLKNLLKLKITSMNKSQKNKIIEFINKMDRPIKVHKTKLLRLVEDLS